MKYRADIDGLRSIAILLVILFHAYPRMLPGGFVGVDIFFVISGFLISGVIMEALKTGSFSFAVFYKRRILRIFPGLALTLLACGVAGWFLLWPNEFKSLGKHIAGGSCFISNILLYKETGYFDEASQSKFLLNLWSLGIEEQFYIFFPFFLWLVYRWTRFVTVFLFLLCLASFLDNIFLAGVHPDADFYLPLSRFWELLAGAVLQSLLHGNIFPHSPFKSVCAGAWEASRHFLPTLCGLVCLVMALMICKNDEGQYPGWLALLPVGSAIAFIIAGPDAPFNRFLLGSRIAVYVGKISYAWYLWHWPLLAFAYNLMGRPAYEAAHFVRFCLVAASLGLAALTFRYVENPIRFGSFLGKHKIAILIVLMAAIFGAGLWIWKGDGLIWRLPAGEHERYRQLLPPAFEDKACLEYTNSRAGEFAFCRYANENAPVTVAVLGDSHAHAAFSGIAALGRDMGFNTLLLGRFPQRPGSETEIRRQCAAMLDLLRKKDDIRQIIVVVRGVNYLMREHNPGNRRPEPLPKRDYESLRAEMLELLEQMASTGKPVLVVEDTPDLNADIRDAMPRNLVFAQIQPIYQATPREEAFTRQSDYTRLLEDFAHIPGVSVAHGTLAAFCPDRDCLLFDSKGLPLFYDDDHLSYAGSEYLAQKIIRPELEKTLGTSVR